ncbi:NADP-dependent aldo/keto reductase, unknown biological role, implicated in cellular detoxification [Schizosaccharomyces pombe]|uniref:Putative aryl-alcohol dehydrogenase C750.01 n=1 Tax=Schizosaccharomyces pombe (strain 972 / ATCC 24843) TaxID=284812 RepID=YLZ1_SCHPO|nr:aldo/keto reductase family protein [Schizosaccharomyces pombe]G2TRN6.1 RecName: Full=Putative aryl-alcohol dehydrogenase C750.01 [Schizosaccharomyces pombe 972h-]CAO77652.2 aldo/keto reductase family protein [Schizosaccharomyces pombe]|eukprot:NP_001343040.1 aldo/keto reductase family protein [Schizosaccharomyces pombe]
MSFGKKEYWEDWVLEEEDEVFKIMKAAYDAGIRTFDTANIYSAGVSEELVGKFIRKYEIPRSSIVIMSKCFSPVRKDLIKLYMDLSSRGVQLHDSPELANQCGLSRKHIFDAVQDSVKRLGTYIDVLQIHRYDPHVSAEEVMRALNDVVESGKVRYIGASTMRYYQFIELQNTAEKHGWHKFISMQNYHNLLYREEEREMIPYCQKTGVGLIPWSPLARGLLTRSIDANEETIRSKTDLYTRALEFGAGYKAILSRVEELAKKYNVSMATLATAWSLHKGDYPIVGISKVERLQDALASVTLKLNEEDIKYLEEPYCPVPIQGEI